MFSKKKMKQSTADYSASISKLKACLKDCEAIVIGAGSGLSSAAGLLYAGERFKRLFSDYIEKYGFIDMYSAAFYPHNSLEEFWGYFSKHIYHNRFKQELNDTYLNLFKLISSKNYFVITTNVDHLFQNTGFKKQRLFYTQGDYGLLQCSKACHAKTYDNEQLILKMIERQQDFKIPTELVPHCPQCGAPMTTNLRKDSFFVEDDGWHSAAERYKEFLKNHANGKVLFLELGVGFNTPSIIKYPFWQMTFQNKNAIFASINFEHAVCPKEIKNQSILIESDISTALADLLR